VGVRSMKEKGLEVRIASLMVVFTEFTELESRSDNQEAAQPSSCFRTEEKMNL
jgi:hypothetical protein